MAHLEQLLCLKLRKLFNVPQEIACQTDEQ